MVEQARGAATLKWVAALTMVAVTFLATGCSSSTTALEVQPAYLDSLRGANSLAHGSVDQPPKAALASSAHAAALLKARGEEVEAEARFWKGLIESSGESAVWVAYYLCLSGADSDQVSQIMNEAYS